ncbi:MAG: TonB-dependent receptor [Betaproteobacteria bacterium]|nr:MAG: TonB-dependent receptor [Betaproteobacteria bacterium]
MTQLKRSERAFALDRPFAIKATSAAVSMAVLAMASSVAYAQQAEPKKDEPQKLETLEITGIRKGIESAISVKKNSDSIVESISAEDIGKLPDNSIAESIARLPGVTAQRTAGRAQQISIRGMAPDFSTSLLNGREQVTTGDSRGVEFDQYPSELLAGVNIYKTPDGALVGQGLSGTIDMITVRPLNFAKRTVAAGYRQQQTGVGLNTPEGKGDRIAVSYIDQFADRTIGLAIGFARLKDSGAQTSRFDSWGDTEVDHQGAKVKVPNGFNSWLDKTAQTRQGAMGVLQFKPNKNFESVLDLYYSEFDKNKTSIGFQAPIPGSAGGYDKDGVLTNATISGGVASSGTATNFKGVVRNDTEATLDKLTSIGWNNKLNMGTWTATADLSTSRIKRTGGIFETTAGLPGNAATLDTISWTGFNGRNFADVQYRTGLNYSDPNVAKLTDVQGWGGGVNTPQAGYSKLPFVTDELDAIRLSGKRALGDGLFFSSLDVGVNYTDRSKVREYKEGRLVLSATDPYAAVVAPGAGIANPSGIPVMTWDPRGSVGSTYQIAAKLVRDIANKDWTVNEKVTTAYAKLDLDRELFGLPVRGNAGIQVVNTDQGSSAYNVDGGPCPNDVCAVTNIATGVKYTDVLPSTNLVFDLGNDSVLRFALARVMARPNMNDLRASTGFGVDATLGVLKGDAGNPKLKPFRANALDLSYEKYFGNKGYIGVAGFYKDLRTYIVKQNVVTDFTSLVTPNTPLPVGGRVLGLLNQPVNGSGGNIMGIELSASIPFSLISKSLDGFGVQASYSDTSSSISLPSSGFSVRDVGNSKISLPGLSKRVGSLTMYFEKWGFSARAAARYRSDFVGEVTNIFGDRELTYIKEETITDVQLGYEFQSGPAKGLSILLQANNITNEPYIRYKDTRDNVVETVKYGKTYLLGLNYKF